MQTEISLKVDEYSAAIGKFPKGAMGLTPDEVRKSDAFRTAKSGFDFYFSKLRDLNSKLNKERKCIGYEIKEGKRVCIYKYKK